MKSGCYENFAWGPLWFGSWLLLGLVHFLDSGDVSGSGGIWYKAGDWLIGIGCGDWVF